MKIAAYCRVSTDKDEQLDSLEHQKEFFSEYAQKHGYELVRLYADEGITGTSLRKREEFRRLMRDAALGLFDMVVVKDISRFARNTVDFLQSIRTLKSLGINTLFLTANMESLGESEFVLTVFSALAQEESVNLSKRVKFGKQINAKKGRVPARVYGYERIDNFTLEIKPEEADVIREIYRLYIEDGYGCRQISTKLNKMGCKTMFGCDWNPTGIKRILNNSIYCGRYINGKYEIRDCLEGKLVKTSADRHMCHERPEWAIVSQDTFDEAQRIHAMRAEQYANVSPGGRYSNRHIFSTLIKCELCGRSFSRKVYKYVNTRVYWKCPTNDQFTAETCANKTCITEGDLVTVISEYLQSLISDKERFVNEIITEIKKQSEKKTTTFDVAAAQKKIKALLNKKNKYQEMYVADIIGIVDLKQKVSAIDEELGKLNYSLEKHERASSVESNRDNFVEDYIAEIERFLKLENVTNADMRKVIDHISANEKGEIKIHLKKCNIN